MSPDNPSYRGQEKRGVQPSKSDKLAFLYGLVIMALFLSLAAFLFNSAPTFSTGQAIIDSPASVDLENETNLSPESVQKFMQNVSSQRQLLELIKVQIETKLCIGVSSFKVSNLTASISNRTCQFENRHLPPVIEGNKTAQDAIKRFGRTTLLVIGFNGEQNYHVAPLLFALYAPVFPNIRFCGPSVNGSVKFEEQINNYFDEPEIARKLGEWSYIQKSYIFNERPMLRPGGGETCYYCVNLALETVNSSDAITGVMFLQDDVMWSYWNTMQSDFSYSYPIDDPYNYRTMKIRKIEISENSTANRTEFPQTWWAAQCYYNKIINFFEVMENSTPANRCINAIANRAGGREMAFSSMSDAFYVAKRHFPSVLPAFESGYFSQAFQEIAVATALACVDKRETAVLDASGSMADHTGRRAPFLVFDASRMMMHPFKMSGLVRAMNQEAPPVGDNNEICLYCLLYRYSKQFL